MKNSAPTLATVPSALDHHFRQAFTFLGKSEGHLLSIDPSVFEGMGEIEAKLYSEALEALKAAHIAISNARAVTPTVTRRPRKQA